MGQENQKNQKQKTMKIYKSSLVLAGALFAGGLSDATADAQLRLSDGTPGGTILIVDQGPGDSNTNLGVVSYNGGVGVNWIVGTTAGVSKPIIGSPIAPYMDLSTFFVSQGAGPLTVEFTDTGFTGGGEVIAHIGGNTAGSVTYRTYADPANAPFGKPSLLSSLGPLVGLGFSGTNAGPTLSPSAPYSLTLEAIVQHVGSGSTGFNADLIITPPIRAALGDRVFFDTNGNGIQDPGETGVPGVTVQLLDCENIVLAVTNTSLDGLYLFSDLPPGRYSLRIIAPEGFGYTLQDQGLDDAVDSDVDTNGIVVFCTTLDPGETDRTWDAGLILIPRQGQTGCRTTGGGRQAASFPAVAYVTHGGQVGAPVGNETAFDPDTKCIQGNWQHVRHMRGGNRGNFHAKSFDSLMCACLGCPEDPNAPITLGDLCNPDMRTCGPEPRKAPANKIAFSGVGNYALSRGQRDNRSVLFRVDLEDRGEPGNSSAKGGTRPADRHRIRIWILTADELAQLKNPADRLLVFRMAISAPNGLHLKDGAILGNGRAVPNGTAVFGVRPPDIDDGGDMTHGNHQIHPSIKLCE